MLYGGSREKNAWHQAVGWSGAGWSLGPVGLSVTARALHAPVMDRRSRCQTFMLRISNPGFRGGLNWYSQYGWELGFFFGAVDRSEGNGPALYMAGDRLGSLL